MKTRTQFATATKIKTSTLVGVGVIASIAFMAAVAGTAQTTNKYNIKLDYDNNQKVDSADVANITNVSLGSAKCVIGKVYDLNKDGKTDISDIILLQRIANGPDRIPDLSSYPVCIGYDAKLDYNNDQKVDSADVTSLNNVALGSAKCIAGKVYDLNKDGKTDISDVILLQRITLGLDPIPDLSSYLICNTLSYNAYNVKLDYNNDQKVDSADVTSLNNVALGSATCIAGKVYDLNKDGKTDISDIILLQRIVNGLNPIPDLSSYPVCVDPFNPINPGGCVVGSLLTQMIGGQIGTWIMGCSCSSYTKLSDQALSQSAACTLAKSMGVCLTGSTLCP